MVVASRSAYADALALVARRELSVAECRTRLLDRDHEPAEIEAALSELVTAGALDDGRVARAYARTAVAVKGRGRLRIARELDEKGIPKQIANEALAEVFGELDERSLVSKAVQKKLRGRPGLSSTSEYASLYQYLMRQGFSPGVVVAELRKLRGTADRHE
jgi:regulatory protein